MPKDTGIITDYKAVPDKNDALRWLIDAHFCQFSQYKRNEEHKNEYTMYIIEAGLKRLFGVEVDYSGNVPKYYRVSREYIE